MTKQIRTAITRSITHTERVHVDYSGSHNDLLAELRDIDPDCGAATENDGTVDVWGCTAGGWEWRLRVSVLVVVGPWGDGASSGHIVCHPRDLSAVRPAYDEIEEGADLERVHSAGGWYRAEEQNQSPPHYLDR
jgi:hypothetical protein